MAFQHRCVNCGHEEEDHINNLVNEPELGKFKKRSKGYRMDILTCMEARWSPEYRERVTKLHWGSNRAPGMGYASPCPEQEAAEFDSRPSYAEQCSFVIIYNPNTGETFMAQIDG